MVYDWIMEPDTRICPKCSEEIRPARRLGPHLSGHKRTENAKYRYFNGDTKHPYELKACKQCGKEDWMQTRHEFCSYRCSQLRENNSYWKGSEVKYLGAHGRVYRTRGPAIDQICAFCGEQAKEWAHIHDTEPSDPNNYQPLCKPCHGRYDHPPWSHCKRGHPMRLSKSGKSWYCLPCAKRRAEGGKEKV